MITTDIRAEYLDHLNQELDSCRISAAEYTSLCLLPGLAQNKVSFQKNFLTQNECANSKIIEFLRRYNWKGYSHRIRRSLYQWHHQQYPLVLYHHTPTPYELLKIQATGKRVVTVFRNIHDWKHTYFGKTTWEFIVHDLIHADHFFEKPDWRDGQIRFYQFILDNWEHPLIQAGRQFNSSAFDYLISDMNSHPQHLNQTLSAILLSAWKTQKGLDSTEYLNLQKENSFQNDLKDLYTAYL